MNDPWTPEVGGALLVDVLLSLGVDDPHSLSHAESVAKIEQAAVAGQIDPDTLAALHEMDALSKP